MGALIRKGRPKNQSAFTLGRTKRGDGEKVTRLHGEANRREKLF